jgi:hypothetical protein
MNDGGGAGDQKDVGRTAKQPGERDLHGRRAEPPGDVGQRRRLQRTEPAERKERHIGDAVAGQIVDKGVVGPMRQIVLVLDADDLGDPPSFRDLPGRDVAQTDMPHQTLPLEFGQGRERRLDRSLGRAMRIEHDPKIDHLQRVEPEIAQIVMHGPGQFRGREGRQP